MHRSPRTKLEKKQTGVRELAQFEVVQEAEEEAVEEVEAVASRQDNANRVNFQERACNAVSSWTECLVEVAKYTDEATRVCLMDLYCFIPQYQAV